MPVSAACRVGFHPRISTCSSVVTGSIRGGTTDAKSRTFLLEGKSFPADTAYFGPGPAPFMVNYRVRDLDAMLAQLRAAGVQVDDRVEDHSYGRFGWAVDPEGNRFELWQPK